MTVSHLFPNKMAVTMALFWVSLVLSVIGTNAAGEYSILHCPDSLSFLSVKDPLSESLLKEIFSASLGLSVEENSEWKGLYVSDPFNTPEAVVEIYVDGVSSLGGLESKDKTYPLKVDEYEPDTFKALKHRIQQRFTSGGNKIVNINLSDAKELESPEIENAFGHMQVPKVPKQSLAHLKYSVEEDYQFLFELEILKTITKQLKTILPDNIVDFYQFRMRSLHSLSDYHGPSSLQTKEAKKLLGEALQDLNKAFVDAYDGSVLVTVVVTDVAHTRRTVREVPEEEGAPAPVDAPAAEEVVQETTTAAQETTTASEVSDDDNYDADYPAIFNILLWFGVVFAFTLVAIVYAIMDMDPGRDSIIYRMTSTRMKKDN